MSQSSGKEFHTELRTKAIGFEIFSEVEEKTPSIFESQWWENQILEWCMKDEEIRTHLLRFVDVFPSLRTPRQTVNHLRQYFPRSDKIFPAFLRLSADISNSIAATRAIFSHETRAMMTRMARRFIAGENIEESLDALKDIRRQGMTFTLDPLGEAVVSEIEAEKYMNGCLDALHLLASDWKEIEAEGGQKDLPNLSLKISSLCANFDPVDEDGVSEHVKQGLRQIFRTAKEEDAFVNVDMEQSAYCELTIKIFQGLLEEEEFKDFSGAGIVIQTYLQRSEKIMDDLFRWVDHRGTPITIRLVKGAYWDYEVIHARQMGWPIPVFTTKAETDASFERLTDILLDHFPKVRPAIGSHNIRSIAHAMAAAEAREIDASHLEFQMLYGMGEPIKRAILKTDYPLRIYTPFGDLIPGMAYLVRRILENTSNESFLRQDFFMGLSPEELLANPAESISAKSKENAVSNESAHDSEFDFENEPVTDFSISDSRKRMRKAIDGMEERLGKSYPMIIGGGEVESAETTTSVNPSHKRQVVGIVSQASPENVERAVQIAKSASEEWSQTPPRKRAAVLFRAAEIICEKRFELSALAVFEVGKTWSEADADVVEAIDFLRYYGSEMVRLSADPPTERLAGETNDYIYRPRGVGAIIAPWNFPIAILMGMTSAAIAAGNTIIMKPSGLSPVCAANLMRIYMEAGIPSGVVNFLPGSGKIVGEGLVKSHDIDFIAFTGSRETGERISRIAAETPSRNGVKKVIAEMGGKNAIIIDESADLDEAVVGVVASAFGYQGQKCSAASRVIVLDSVYEAFIPRLIEATRSLHVGPAEDPSTQVGPMIDEAALQKTHTYIEIGKRDAKLLLEVDVSHLSDGFYAGPAIFADVDPQSPLGQEEIFGPVLSVVKCKGFDQALQVANNTEYGLTGGLYSRTPRHIEMARRDLMVGNLYINRKITGAIVRRQPFGGFKMSGIGSKAGGPDYLIQFLLPQTITENVMRHGFAPLEDI